MRMLIRLRTQAVALFVVIPALVRAAPALAQASPARAANPLRDTVSLYSTDRAALNRRYSVDYAPAQRARFREFHNDWRRRLQHIDFDALSQEGRVDYVLLDTELKYQLALLDRDDRLIREMEPWIPFAGTIFELEEARRQMGPIDPPALARTLANLAGTIDSLHEATQGKQPSRIIARRTALLLDDLDRTLDRWHGFYGGYDPEFTWWTSEPYTRADEALGRYTKYLRETVAGIKPGEAEPIVGDPIGEAGLQADLRHEMIPYTIPELIAIAEREYAWCETELKKAAREMGFGDDWRAALEKVKQTYVPPGDQPALIVELAREAEEFVESRDLVTVPPLAKEVWRMEMMSPERQRVSPFFLGGEVIRVSYPTDGMTHEDKLMSMRGNNPYFSRATVHHELIPGHHLQGFMTSRYNTHRSVFSTPFWGEGWALYWEMLLWDLGFPQTPEQRMGMLFWRTHRAARIIFSLRFHLGQMTPQEAVDFLVERVGHERANAEGEVRRSFSGDYSPLYQAAYMLGGLQFRALHRDLVESGRMTDRAFHDAILQGGRMPVEMVRARLTGEPLTRDYTAKWRFYQNR
jgi:uncharacterized protein (DUF885 family)